MNDNESDWTEALPALMLLMFGGWIILFVIRALWATRMITIPTGIILVCTLYNISIPAILGVCALGALIIWNPRIGSPRIG